MICEVLIVMGKCYLIGDCFECLILEKDLDLVILV